MTPWRAVLNRRGEPIALLRGLALGWRQTVPMRPEWEGGLQGLLAARCRDVDFWTRRDGVVTVQRKGDVPSACEVPSWVDRAADAADLYNPDLGQWGLGERLTEADGSLVEPVGRPLFIAFKGEVVAVVRVMEVERA